MSPRVETAGSSIVSGLWIQGELMNQPAWARDLGLSEDSPASSVLEAARQRWSFDLAGRLGGVRAAAAWTCDRLALYRDASGLGTVAFRDERGGRSSGVAFSTTLQAPVLHAHRSPRLARKSLHEFLRFLEIVAPNTIYEGVRMLEPGQLARWSGDGHFEPALATCGSSSPVPSDFGGAVGGLDGLLHRAVQTSLEAMAEPAVFLSGGIDSSLLAALGSRTRPDIVAVTVGFEGQRYDEAPLAARIASHLGIRHEVLRFSHRDYLGAFERLSQTLAQPMADPATPATVLAFDHCRRRYDVALDGTGADEAVGSLPPRHIRMAVQYGSLVPRPARAALVRVMCAIPRLADYTPLLDFEHPADAMMRWRGFTRPEIEELCGEPVSFEHTQYYRTFARFPRHSHFERYGALLDAMPGDRLSEAMRATGLRVRFPFFDRSANDFIRQLPVEFRSLPGQPKRILRALLARYVPRDIWDVPKHGFDFPLHQFLQADDHALVHRYLLSGPWLDLGVLKADVVRRYARRFIAGDQGMTFRVWALVVLGAWLERHPMQRSG
jgi:asparagine synthase (glutamine-hydrolysing)